MQELYIRYKFYWQSKSNENDLLKIELQDMIIKFIKLDIKQIKIKSIKQ